MDIQLSAGAIDLPWARSARHAIYPVFLPFMGCRHRCVFCAQQLQTGREKIAGQDQLRVLLAKCRQELTRRRAEGRPAPELAFYGGTFTAIPPSYWKICLDFSSDLYAAGLITGLRCSTRPDCLDDRTLGDLANAGFEMIELGIQSFSDKALKTSRRGYTGTQAKEGCERIRAFGFRLGAQLLPGLPGGSPEAFAADVSAAIGCGVSALRFYPCLVFAGSALARWWSRGEYRPWTLPQTIRALTEGFLQATLAGVPVIRMGVAPEGGVRENILAGPWDEALGSRVMGLALYGYLSSYLRCGFRVFLPANTRGYVWGWRKELKSLWMKTDARYWDEEFIRLLPGSLALPANKPYP